MKLPHLLIPGFLIATIAFPTEAQITVDGTTNTTLNPIETGIQIDEGNRAGDNLFHSFRDFSVPNGSEAFFNNAADVTNIFSRVTGGNISNIDGLIRANGTANLFLLNPSGILFGPNATLNIGGSFYGSTADSILFADGTEFSALDGQNQPILTINAPIGLNFRDNPADIAVRGSNLTVQSGQNLTLLGGNLNFTEGTIIFAPGANIELGGLSASGIISLDENFKPSFPEDIARANISFTETTRINVAGSNGGSITINTGNVVLNDRSGLIAGIEDNNGSPDAQAGDIVINASNNITFEGGSFIRNQVGSAGEGNAGNIEIETFSLMLNNDSSLGGLISGQGNSGNVTINASEDIVLNQSRIINQVNASGIGNAGDIFINANTFEAIGDSETRSALTSRTQGMGNAGSINLDIEQSISLETSTIISQVDDQGVGLSGNILVEAGSLTLMNNSRFQASTAAEGDAGNIIIDIAGDINFDNNSRVFSQVLSGAEGNAGDIQITADGSLNSANTFIIADTRARGNAGNIMIDVAEDINFDSNNRVLSQVQSGAEGNAGDIQITAGGSLNSVNTFIIADSKDRGSSGDITIDVADTITLQGEAPNGVSIFPSGIITGLDEARTNDANRDFISSGQGEAGNINISARELIIKDLGFISSSTEDNTVGDAGNIIVNVENLSLTDNGFIASFTENITEDGFDAGSINVNARTVELLRGGKFIAITDGDGDAGNINLNVTERLMVDGSGEPSLTSDLVSQNEPFIQALQGETGLFANASERATGNGGNINIGAGEITSDGDGFTFDVNQSTNEVSVINEGEITADSQGTGSGGQISIRANDLTLDYQGKIVAITSFVQDENTETSTETSSGEISLGIDNQLILRNDSLISAQALNNADGGNIDINAEFVIAFPSKPNGSDIIASADGGNGGNISIIAEEIFGLQERVAIPGNGTNDIDVSSQFGFDGNVSIQTPDVQSIESLAKLSSNVVEQNNSFAQVCSTDSIVGSSRFVIKGRGGITPQPTEVFTADSILGEQESADTEGYNNNLKKALEAQYPPIPTDEGDIYPARGVIIREDGTITLTAYPVSNNTQRALLASRNCTTKR